MAREGVRPFGPTALVTMMKCRLNGGGLCPRHESVDSPSFCVPHMAIVQTYSGLTGGGGVVGGKWVRMSYISSFLPRSPAHLSAVGG